MIRMGTIVKFFEIGTSIHGHQSLNTKHQKFAYYIGRVMVCVNPRCRKCLTCGGAWLPWRTTITPSRDSLKSDSKLETGNWENLPTISPRYSRVTKSQSAGDPIRVLYMGAVQPQIVNILPGRHTQSLVGRSYITQSHSIIHNTLRLWHVHVYSPGGEHVYL